MKVTVKNNPDMQDFLIVTILYRNTESGGFKEINLHNDTWVDIRDALQAYWKAETEKRANQ